MLSHHLAAADRIRERHATEVDRIRSRHELTDVAKRARIAKVTFDAKTAMTDLQQSADAETQAEQLKLRRNAFGVTDLPGDRATTIVSSRDAADRAAALTVPADAAALLDRSDQSGDEVLARAVASVAFDRATGGDPDQGWDAVVQAFLTTRPDRVDDVQKLADIVRTSRSMLSGDVRNLFAFVLAAPPEVAGVSLEQMQQLADANGIG